MKAIKAKTVRGYILAAAKLIEQYGWTRGAYRKGSRYCVMGALQEDKDAGTVACLARCLVRKKGVTSEWNDDVAKSGREVVKRLREIARTA